MEKLKGIVVENEFELPLEVKYFTEDFAELFEKVHVEYNCLHRDVKGSFANFISQFDAIIASSTFFYREQLEDFADLFSKSEKKYSFFLYNFDFSLEKMLRSDSSYTFRDHEKLKENIAIIFQKHKVYTFGMKYSANEGEDYTELKDNFDRSDKSFFMFSDTRSENKRRKMQYEQLFLDNFLKNGKDD